MAKLVNATCPYCGQKNRHRQDSIGLPVNCKWCGKKYELVSSARSLAPTSCASCGGCLLICIAALIFLTSLASPSPETDEVADRALLQPQRRKPVDETRRTETQENTDEAKDGNELASDGLSKPKADHQAIPSHGNSSTENTNQEECADPDHKGEFRTWTSTYGSTTFARLKSIQNELVKLEKENGDIIDVSVDKLSKADQTYLETVKRTGKR